MFEENKKAVEFEEKLEKNLTEVVDKLNDALFGISRDLEEVKENERKLLLQELSSLDSLDFSDEIHAIRYNSLKFLKAYVDLVMYLDYWKDREWDENQADEKEEYIRKLTPTIEFARKLHEAFTYAKENTESLLYSVNYACDIGAEQNEKDIPGVSLAWRFEGVLIEFIKTLKP